jgi:hypothetical protein
LSITTPGTKNATAALISHTELVTANATAPMIPSANLRCLASTFSASGWLDGGFMEITYIVVRFREAGAS